MYKIYTKSNYFYIEDTVTNLIYEALAKDVRVRRKLTTSTEFFFDNVNSFNGSQGVEFADIQDENGVPYSDIATFITFYEENTGKSSPSESGGVSDGANWTGWAQYGDSKYTELLPLVVSAGTTSVIDIDGLSNTIKTQLPVGVSDLYDVSTSKITPISSGDGYIFTLGFKASNTSNNGDATIFVDIGGVFNRLFARVFRFPRGSGTAHEFYFSSSFYTLNTFLANGGLIKIESGIGNTSVYDIVLQVHRTHKSRI